LKTRRIALIACLSMALLAGHAAAGRLFGIPDDGTADIVELDPLTGAEINRFASPGQAPADLAGLGFDGTSLFFIQNGRITPEGAVSMPVLYELDPANGTIIDQDMIFGTSAVNLDGIGAAPGTVVIQDYADSAAGGTAAPDLFVFDTVTDVMVDAVDVHAGAPAFISMGGLGLASSPDGGLLMEDYDDLYFVDPTGAATLLASLDMDIYGVAVMGEEVFLGTPTMVIGDPTGGPAASIGYIHVHDVTTGAWIRTMELPYGVGGLGAWEDLKPEVIPEPTTMALLGLGLAAMARRRRRK